ncbi:hypothetical protein PbB2_02613 [Candidatus Phycosocius bacilliformis]|uniref:DUF2283 domain-containing protein n=1 Tax=Candidatus Phycosocius bacilliformis TaxID=1445552 RepID=A0A2P2ECY3_9PROT|nr:hypothetical protein [Candidatus Phycosocius bacilliformis]GBF58923.1 hypothetical protein PbB2_02613 [Candidatus Phycosocius bacilliformis]
MVDFDLTYDHQTDVLYVTTKLTGASFITHGDDGIVWSHQIEDGQLVSMTVVDFMSHWQGDLAALTGKLHEQLFMPCPTGPVSVEAVAN